jgi:hypothetical protein
LLLALDHPRGDLEPGGKVCGKVGGDVHGDHFVVVLLLTEEGSCGHVVWGFIPMWAN